MPNYDDYLDFHYADEYVCNAYEDIDDLYDQDGYYDEDDYDTIENQSEWDSYYHSVADEIAEEIDY
jgi:hypothetical protein